MNFFFKSNEAGSDRYEDYGRNVCCSEENIEEKEDLPAGSLCNPRDKD